MGYKPFKMKGSPMQRNFGIGESEAPDATSPNNKIDSEKIRKALAAGMATLPGGFDAYGQSKEKEKEEEEEETFVPKKGEKFKKLFRTLFPEKVKEEEEEETDE